ncbi:MAG TPA: hypothetical protein PKE65_08290 [Rhizobiaceae bacterium]|nr:hypothetical protein [Rhizobiaceae bacterium]
MSRQPDLRDYDLAESDTDPMYGTWCKACGASSLVAGDPPSRMGSELDEYIRCDRCGASLGTLREIIVADRLRTGAPVRKLSSKRHAK